jgi:hypothetical protein
MMPGLAQTPTPVVGPASSATNGPASIPDFSRVWNHPSLPCRFSDAGRPSARMASSCPSMRCNKNRRRGYVSARPI